jgi:DNA-binding Xre family transcriptional regulator
MKQTKLKQILEDRGMTQKDLYVQMKEICKTPIPLYQISKICSGKSINYNTSTLVKICATLMVTPNEVLSKEDYFDLFISPDING